MAIEITRRHIELTSMEKERAEKEAMRLRDEYPGVEHVHVILDGEKHRRMAEVVVQGKNHIRMEGQGVSDTVLKALDIAIERVDRQLRRARKKVQAHRGSRTADAVADPVEDIDGEDTA